MKTHTLLLTGTALLLAACGEGPREEAVEHATTVDVAEAPNSEFGFAEAMEQGPSAPRMPPAVSPPSPPSETRPGQSMPDRSVSHVPSVSVGIPQVAYTFAYGFRVPSNIIRPLQERHADMCDAKGPQVCRIVSMNQGEREGDYAYGTLTLAVAGSQARQFGKELSRSTGEMKGELVSSSIQGEDLSKSIVDTEARLEARTVLRDRLMEVLRNRKGTVAELVEAERGVAQVNEEIDQARSWLTEMRARVAYSTMTIEYEAGTPTRGGFLDPIRNAWGKIGAIFGNLIALMILLVTVIVPIGLLVWGAVRLFRRLGLSTGIGSDGWTRPVTVTENETKAD